MEFEHDDGETGALIETPYYSVGDSDIQRGDHVFFLLKHPAFRSFPKWPELVGEVLHVFAGHEIVYSVKIVTTGVLRWPDRLVPRSCVTKVFVPDY